jgi:hypothetical protein
MLARIATSSVLGTVAGRSSFEYLLDTNVISELRKGERAEAKVRAWFEGLDEEIY